MHPAEDSFDVLCLAAALVDPLVRTLLQNERREAVHVVLFAELLIRGAVDLAEAHVIVRAGHLVQYGREPLAWMYRTWGQTYTQ